MNCIKKKTYVQTVTKITHLVMSCLCAVVLIAASVGLTGCDSQEKKRITVSVWDPALLDSEFTRTVEELNPDYEIMWLRGSDSNELYQFQANHGSMPDVVLVQHVDERAHVMQDSLYDLKDSTLASEQQASLEKAILLDQIPGNDDHIVWIPASDTFVGVVINQYLFDLYNVAVPTNKEEFIKACADFQAKGITPLAANYADEETFFKVAQSVFSDFLQTQEGIDWRNAYQAGTTTSLDESAWLPFFEQVKAAYVANIVSVDDCDMTGDEAKQAFLEGSAAMIFVTGEDLDIYGNDHNMTVRALPNYSSTSRWLSAQPAFYGGVSNVESEGVKVEDSEAAHQGALDVLTSIMSDEAQQAYFNTCGLGEAYTFIADADNEKNIFEYTSSLSDEYKQDGVNDAEDAENSQETQEVDRSDQASYDSQIQAFALIISDPHLADCIGGVLHEQIRGKTEIAGDPVSQEADDGAVQQETPSAQNLPTQLASPSDAVAFDTLNETDGATLVRQEELTYDAWTAFLSSDKAKEESEWLSLANRELQDVLKDDQLVVTTFAEGMSNVWNADRGNIAGSSIGRSVNEVLGSDFVIMSPYSIRTPLYPGDMTTPMLRYPVADDPVYVLHLAGSDIKALLNEMLEQTGDYRMPVLAGLKMTVSKGKEGVSHLNNLERTLVPKQENQTTPAGQSGHEVTQTFAFNDDDIYTVVLTGPESSLLSKKAQELHGVEQGRTLQDIWVDYFQTKGDMSASLLPSVDYLDMM